MRLSQILTVRVFAFVQVRDGIETKSIHAHGQPEVAHLLHGIVHGRIIKIQIRLMRIKPMPIVRFCDGVPRPVRCFEIFEDDSRVLEFLRSVAPDIEVLVSEVIAVAGVVAAACDLDPARPEPPTPVAATARRDFWNQGF